MIQKMKSFFTGLNTIYTYIITSKILFLFTIILIFFFGKYFNDIQEYLTFQAYLFREALFFTYDYFFSSPLPTNISETENIIKSESNYPSKKKILIICGITVGVIITGVGIYCFIPTIVPIVTAIPATTVEVVASSDLSSFPGFLVSLLSSIFASSSVISDLPITSSPPDITIIPTSSSTNYLSRFVNFEDNLLNLPNEELNPTSSSSNFERGVMSHGQVIDNIDTFLDN